jgi:hypothetical protein
VRFQAGSAGRRISDGDELVLDHAELAGSDFSSRKLARYGSIGSILRSCQFDGARIKMASFGAGTEMSHYIDCSFDGARITFAPGGYARFVRCSFRNVDLRDWFCFGVEMVDCVFTGHLRKAAFNGTVPEDKQAVIGRTRNEWRGNDFSGMDLVDVAFRTGIDLTLQCLPSGGDYLYLPDAAGTIERAKSAVLDSSDDSVRDAAIRLIKILEYALTGGQRQLLLRRSTYKSMPRTVVDAVFDTLQASQP